MSFLSLVIISMMAVTAYLGLSFSAEGLLKSANLTYETERAADIEINALQLMTDGSLEQIRSTEGVTDAEGIISIPSRVSQGVRTENITLRTVSERISRPHLKEGRLPEAEGEIQAVSEAEQFWARVEDISCQGRSVRKNLLFLEPETKMVSLTDLQNRPMEYPREGIVLSSSVAKDLGVKEGDIVTVGETETPVTGISHQMAIDFQYLPAAETDLYRKAEKTGWMVRLKDGADGTEIASRLYREKGYVTTLMKSVMKKGYEDVLNQFDLYAWMLVVLCGIVGIFIIVNTGWNNLHEQKLSLSVLRAIGFQQRQISARWFLQSLLYLVFSLLIGYGVGQILAKISMEMMSNSTRHFEYFQDPYQYVWTGISTFVFILAGHLVTMRSMKKWDLVESTKGRE